MSLLAVARRRLVWLLLAGLVATVLATLVAPASAATATVTLNGNGPTPQAITINRGDTVRFVNQDNGSHTITSNAGAWSYSATIAAGASATTPAFAAAGQFGYRDSFFIAVVQQNVNGTISVRAPSPSPTPSATRSPTPAPKPSATRSPTPAATPSASASATPSGMAIIPGIDGVPTLAPTAGPTPDVAPPETALPTPTVVAYGPKSAIVQSSPHSFGLPVLLALLAAVGTLSLIVRVLLAQPAPIRRTDEVVEHDPS